ncbi:MAG: hypothetical protein PHU63_03445, partial [Candidatus ainarchaeum sp.]|nr:hypothetical protein [Candidatus ainarchaeum sp.]
KYTSAVEAALGGRLLYVVVDSTDTATKAISVLKKLKAGRATFIPLDRITVKKLDKKNNLLLNYITYSDEVSKAVEFSFSDTVLVDNIDSARKNENLRVVTLDGELFDKTGTITGGKTAGSLLISSQIKKLEEEAENMKDSKNSLMSRLEHIREEGNNKRKEKAETEVKLRSIEIERKAFKENEDRLKRIKLSKESVSAEIKKSDELVSLNLKKKQEFLNNYKLLENKITELEQKYSEEDKKVKEKYEQMSKRRSDIASKISSLKATISGKEKELEIRKTETRKLEIDLKTSNDEKTQILSDITKIKREIPALSQDLEKREDKVRKSSREMENIMKILEDFENRIKSLGEERGKIKLILDKIYKEKHDREIQEATLKTRLIDLKSEYEEYVNVQTVSLGKEDLIKNITESETVLNSIESVNIASIELYETKKQEVEELDSKIELLKNERKAVLSMVKEIERKKREIFFETFNAIDSNFRKMLETIPLGEGYLYLDNPEDPFESNLLIKIKKHGRESSIDSLSGGESSLLALAFIFSIQFFKPSPFYVLDEADAALDKQNSKHFSDLIKQISKDSQFIAVSHNDTVIEGANAVLGVTRIAGVSKIVGVKFDSKAA